ncbi:hypothetical protein FACS1894125_6720 [Actinomycetota bacterium]|nr:hypothetical protein FACS1894125_6720 [Actinomycetota bacterium]
MDKFEKGVEGAVNTVFSKIGSRELKPVDFVVALRAEMDAKVIAVKNDRKVAPNVYIIVLSTPDFDKIEIWGPQELANELVASLSEHSAAEGYSLIGEVVVSFEENTENKAGEYQIKSDSQPSAPKEEAAVPAGVATSALAPVPAAQSSAPASAQHPFVEINGQRHVLDKNITLLGRGSDCDIILEDTSASRKHMELRVTPTGTIASDLQSTNGIYIEGNKTTAANLVDGNTITIGKTIIRYYTPKSLSPVNRDENIFDTQIRKTSGPVGLANLAGGASPAVAVAPTPAPAPVPAVAPIPEPVTVAPVAPAPVPEPASAAPEPAPVPTPEPVATPQVPAAQMAAPAEPFVPSVPAATPAQTVAPAEPVATPAVEPTPVQAFSAPEQAPVLVASPAPEYAAPAFVPAEPALVAAATQAPVQTFSVPEPTAPANSTPAPEYAAPATVPSPPDPFKELNLSAPVNDLNKGL